MKKFLTINMKSNIICIATTCSLLLGCQKERMTTYTGSNSNNTTNPARPIVTTGWENLLVSLPQDSVRLQANVAFINGDFTQYSLTWSKLEGPGTITFGDATKLSSVAKGLQEGLYAFEAKAIAPNGFISRDTQTVIVGRLSTQPKNFDLGTYALSLEWSGFFARIGNIYDVAANTGVKRNTYFELQVKSKQTNNQWETASSTASYTASSRYVYQVYSTGELFIYDLTTEAKASDWWSVRILYN